LSRAGSGSMSFVKPPIFAFSSFFVWPKPFCLLWFFVFLKIRERVSFFFF